MFPPALRRGVQRLWGGLSRRSDGAFGRVTDKIHGIRPVQRYNHDMRAGREEPAFCAFDDHPGEHVGRCALGVQPGSLAQVLRDRLNRPHSRSRPKGAAVGQMAKSRKKDIKRDF